MTLPTDRVPPLSVGQVQQRLPKVDEEVTYLAVWSKEKADVALAEHTQRLRQHSETLDRHTAFHKDHQRDLAFLRMATGVNAAKVEGKFSRIEDDVNELKADVGTLKNDVNELKADVSTLKNDVNELKTDVSTLKDDVNELKTDVSTLKDDVNELKTDVSTLKTDMFEVKGTLAVILSRLPAAA